MFRQNSVNRNKTAYIVNLPCGAMTSYSPLQMLSNLSLIHMTKLLHMTSNFVIWCKITLIIAFITCEAFLLHMKNLAPQTLSAASATIIMYARYICIYQMVLDTQPLKITSYINFLQFFKALALILMSHHRH